jgi:hypothetical protein
MRYISVATRAIAAVESPLEHLKLTVPEMQPLSESRSSGLSRAQWGVLPSRWRMSCAAMVKLIARPIPAISIAEQVLRYLSRYTSRRHFRSSSCRCRRRSCHLHLERLPQRSQHCAHDAVTRRVYAPFSPPRPARRLPAYPPLRLSCQRHSAGQARPHPKPSKSKAPRAAESMRQRSMSQRRGGVRSKFYDATRARIWHRPPL